MRRLLSISLILLFWLGPFAAVLSGIDESRLPLCCRRHGAHHCADADTQSAGSGHAHISSRCPQFPAAVPASTTAAFASAAEPASAASVVGEFTPRAGRNAIRVGQSRTQADRGPPSSSLS
jgi:hypothetical protein